MPNFIKAFWYKPDWKGVKSLLLPKQLKREAYLSLSNIFPKIGSRLLGWQFFTNILFSFLCIRTTIGFFHISGNFLFWRDSSKLILKVKEVTDYKYLLF